MPQYFRQEKLTHQHRPFLDGVDSPPSPDGLADNGFVLCLGCPGRGHNQGQVHGNPFQVGIGKYHFAQWPRTQVGKVAVGDLDGCFGDDSPRQQQGFPVAVQHDFTDKTISVLRQMKLFAFA